MRSYEAARRSFNFFEFLARGTCLIGGIIALCGAAGASMLGGQIPTIVLLLLGAIPGGIVALLGFYGLALAQMGRASVDSAEYSQQSLQLSRDQYALAQKVFAWHQAQRAATTGIPESATAAPQAINYDTDAPPTNPLASTPKEMTHMGYTVIEQDGQFLVEGETFATLPDAHKHIVKLSDTRQPQSVRSQLGVNPNAVFDDK